MKFHYFVTILCANTRVDFTTNGLEFHATCIAKDDTEAIVLATTMANTMWETMFKDFAPTLYANGSIKLFPMTNKPNFKISVEKSVIVSAWGDCHDVNLRQAINEIWASVEYRKKLVPIMRSLYERDCDELANFYDNECVWWKANEVTFDEMVKMVSFESLCEVMLSHILDDADYKAIIAYVRPKLSFVENWWELV